VKLVGFGRALRKGAPKLSNKVVSVEPLFIAPEADNDMLTDKQDSWACGIILLEMLTGERKY
jgi:serine/threonine protein kinase